MIWHVIKNDLRSQWWLGPLLVVAAAGYAYSFAFRMSQAGNGVLAGLVLYWPHAVAAMALSHAIQVDSPAVRRSDWHTRPLSRWRVLAAKLSLAAFGVLLPWGLADFLWGLGWGLSPGDALGGAAIHMLSLGSGLVAIMAIAAATPGLMALVAALGLAAVGVGAYMLIFDLLNPIFHGSEGYYSLGLIQGLLGLMAVGAVIALLVLYHCRCAGKAWVMILIATLGIEAGGMVAGRLMAFHWPSLVQAESQATRNVAVAVTGPPVLNAIGLSNDFAFAQLSTPVSWSVPAGVTVGLERYQVDRVWRSGAAAHFLGGRVRRERTGLLRSDISVDSPIDFQQRQHPQEQRYDARLRLRVQQTLPGVALAADGATALPGGGSCRLVRDPQRPQSPAIECVSSRWFCLDVMRPGDVSSWFGDGCSNASRIKTGFYTARLSNDRFFTRTGPVTLIQHLDLGLIDRRFSVGWFTPEVRVKRPNRPPPSPPVNGK